MVHLILLRKYFLFLSDYELRLHFVKVESFTFYNVITKEFESELGCLSLLFHSNKSGFKIRRFYLTA